MKQVTNVTATKKVKTKPAISPEDRENQLISLAYAAVEERLRNGTATSQETTFFLRLGSSKEKMEKEKMAVEMDLLNAKKEAIESAETIKNLYAEALVAMKDYKGESPDKEDKKDDEELF